MLAVLGRLVDPGPELLDLVGLVGEGQRAGLLEVAVDAVGPGEVDQGPEVVDALLLEALELVREVADAVGQAVGQARLAEATVPADRAVADGLRLEDRDPQARVRVGQRERGPQAGEPATDDRDVDVEAAPRAPGADRPRRPGPGHAASSCGRGRVEGLIHDAHGAMPLQAAG